MQFDTNTTAMIIGLQNLYNLTTVETSKIALKRMINRAKELGYSTFLSGMRLGMEQWGAANVIDDPVLSLVACPKEAQQQSWQWTQQLMYQKLLEHTSTVLLVNGDIYKWMCDRSSLVLAVWDDQEAEIQTELVYVKTVGLKGIIFNPLAVDYKAL